MKLGNVNISTFICNIFLGIATVATFGTILGKTTQIPRKYSTLIGSRGLWNDFANTSIQIKKAIKKATQS